MATQEGVFLLMRQLTSLQDLHLNDAWVTIGSFDGVHRGHQAIVGQLVQAAHAQHELAVVVTFFPHPAVVLRHIESPYYLTSPEERADLLGRLGIDYIVTLAFDLSMAQLSAAQFVQALHDHLGLRHLWVGHDFSLGHDREGTVPVLQQLGRQMGFDVKGFDTIMLDDEPVSSSRIRQALGQGEMAEVARMLGRWYRLTGQVVPGDNRGHTLGIPTANLGLWPYQLLPANGIYATRAWVNGEMHAAATNVGWRPTFEKEPVPIRVEALLLDYAADLYGQMLSLDFIEYLRPEQRFPSAKEMLDEIQIDIARSREVLEHAPITPDLSAGPQKAQP
jgi:riboflavin kinase / FMN adenylyltransferase